MGRRMVGVDVGEMPSGSAVPRVVDAYRVVLPAHCGGGASSSRRTLRGQGRSAGPIRTCALAVQATDQRVLLPIEGVTVVLRLMHVVTAICKIFGLPFGAISVTGRGQCALITRRCDAGRTIKVPLSRRSW